MLRRLLLISLLMACDKASHENIDKWTHTEKGPDKLRKALADESIDADLSAHAAANMMVKTGKDADAKSELDQMSPPRRQQVIAKLAPRLWDMARVEGDMSKPSPTQVTAKDQLFGIRRWADDATKQQIDTYLVDWYCTASYEGRAELGASYGYTVMRQLGDHAAKKLIEVANGVIAAPGQQKVKNRIGDGLLVGMAATCTPETVKMLLEIIKLAPDRKDETLAKRAMVALTTAYVDPGGLFDVCPPQPLGPAVDRLAELAKDEGQDGDVTQGAVKLIRTAGPPACLAPLIGMVSHPHSNERFKYVTAQQALRCGGTKAIADVVRALPDVAYNKDDLDGVVVSEIATMSPRAEVLETLRGLLNDKSRVARWVAVEALAAMKSVEDAARVAAVKSNEPLTGYWGNPDKAPPTLGQRAKELAAQLQKGGK